VPPPAEPRQAASYVPASARTADSGVSVGLVLLFALSTVAALGGLWFLAWRDRRWGLSAVVPRRRDRGS
jgi:hypothetical protein